MYNFMYFLHACNFLLVCMQGGSTGGGGGGGRGAEPPPPPPPQLEHCPPPTLGYNIKGCLRVHYCLYSVTVYILVKAT